MQSKVSAYAGNKHDNTSSQRTAEKSKHTSDISSGSLVNFHRHNLLAYTTHGLSLMFYLMKLLRTSRSSPRGYSHL